jgi:hypothetical protein
MHVVIRVENWTDLQGLQQVDLAASEFLQAVHHDPSLQHIFREHGTPTLLITGSSKSDMGCNACRNRLRSRVADLNGSVFCGANEVVFSRQQG